LILDTNGLSAIADGEPKMEPVLRRASEIAIPVIVLGEYRFGIAQSRERTRYEYFLNQIISDCRVLIVDEETAIKYADIRDKLKRKGKPIPGNDLWIAALSIQHALPLLSCDLHFDSVPGLKRIGW
jgi:tRNA(fMet)-specific endonuclease VapC